MNNLDRALRAMQRSPAATPEFYRQLAQGELWFLLRYHPEIEGQQLELQNGSPLPFIQFKVPEGPAVALFSSAARVDEWLDKDKIPPRRYSTGSMPAPQMLGLLGGMGLHAIVNHGCATGTIVIPPDLMRDLANGRALAPIVPGATEQGLLNILNPADYPTHIIQPLFELMRQHAPFRAAWIFSFPTVAAAPAGPTRYQLLILMTPRDLNLFHDLNMTLAAVERAPTVLKTGLGLLDETDADYIAGLFRQAPAFYTAADYRPPSG